MLLVPHLHQVEGAFEIVFHGQHGRIEPCSIAGADQVLDPGVERGFVQVGERDRAEQAVRRIDDEELSVRGRRQRHAQLPHLHGARHGRERPAHHAAHPHLPHGVRLQPLVQVDAVLRQDGAEIGGAVQGARQHGGRHRGERDGHGELIVPGELDHDEDGRYRRAENRARHRAHADHCIGADAGEEMRRNRTCNGAERAAEHGAQKQRRAEHAAAHTAPYGERCRRRLGCDQSDKQPEAVFGLERVVRCAIADAQHLREHHRDQSHRQTRKRRSHPCRHR